MQLKKFFQRLFGITSESLSRRDLQRTFGLNPESIPTPDRSNRFSPKMNFTKPGATRKELTILFSSIDDYSELCKDLDPDIVASTMNSYFEIAVNDCIQATEGTVLKFIGDTIFAMWNAPLPQDNHSELACEAALRLQGINQRIRSPKPEFEIRTRVGVHRGLALVGNFGSSTRVDYTALGECVNLASRMEALNKYLGTRTLITGDVYDRIPAKYITRLIGRFTTPGHSEPVIVHELISHLDKSDRTNQWRDFYAAAFAKFVQRDWVGAQSEFNRVLQLKPGDGPSEFFLKQIEKFKNESLPNDWNGVIPMPEKEVYFR